MRILDAFRSATNHLPVVSGTLSEATQARLEWQRAENARGIIARWPEVERSRLVFSRYWIEDTETGNLYREFGGDPGYAAQVVAHYVRSDGTPVMLEPADPPSRAELERRRAAREQRRADHEAAAKERRRQLIEAPR